MIRPVIAGIGWLLAMAPLGARQIAWFSNAGGRNLASSGAEMDSGHVFRLGVFANGFEPSVANIADWETHWVTAQSTAYEPATKRFGSIYQVTGNTAPFTVGAKAWIFGRKQGASEDGWILFRASGWTWPAPDPFAPLSLDWDAAGADQVLIGSVNPSGSPHLMHAAQVRSFAQWRAAELAGEVLNGAADDPDEDGIPNLLEFAFATQPRVPNPPVPLPLSLVSGHAELAIPRAAGHLARVRAEISDDLTTWRAGEPHVGVLEDSAALLRVRDPVPAGSSHARSFFRVRVELP